MNRVDADRLAETRFPVGAKFGSYVVVAESFVERRRRQVPCECACGRRVIVRGANLLVREGACRSCTTGRIHRVHGETHKGRGTAEYRVWAQMIGRCHRPTNKRYGAYGGRGITVCDRWRSSLNNFIEDMGRRPTSSHQIERNDNDKGYAPDNCRWATRTEQGRNKRNNILLTFSGRTQPLSAWAEERGIAYSTLLRRIRTLGWATDRALTESNVRKSTEAA